MVSGLPTSSVISASGSSAMAVSMSASVMALMRCQSVRLSLLLHGGKFFCCEERYCSHFRVRGWRV